MNDDKTCCATDALRCIRQVKISGIMYGITLLNESLAEIRVQDNLRSRCTDEKIKIFNYILKSVEAEYARALMKEYKPKTYEKLIQKNLNNSGRLS
jgi:hypothetical protein